MKSFLILLFCLGSALSGHGAKITDSTRMPPPGIAVPPEIRAKLAADTAELSRQIDGAKKSLANKPELLDLLPDVQIYFNAVRYALDQDLFYRTNDFACAEKLLAQGHERLRQLLAGQAPWTTATGLVVRGYISKIDGSVQPYGLVVPSSYHAGESHRHRLDFWFHGRGNTLSELNFIRDRQANPGEFAPADTFVLHPYGRFCNAYKFAGEVDVFEALEHVKQHYPIDNDRVSVRGFSMGGAATWHLAAHHAGLWAAASPGAGFADTRIYQKLTGTNLPPWYEQKLWHWYDSKDYAINLFNCGLVAYSGEIDPQKLAADTMSNAMFAEGLTMTHIIGPHTAHKYEPAAKKKVAALVDAIANKGRDPVPRQIKFTTFTLRYNQMAWVTVDGLERHWERARVNAELGEGNSIKVDTTNVSALTLTLPPGTYPARKETAPIVDLDGQQVSSPAAASNGSWSAHYVKSGANWSVAKIAGGEGLRKRHGLQGPIDDAFMDSFIFVRPTGQPMNTALGEWTAKEMNHAIEQWRLQFRGEPRVKNDVDITAADIAANNLVLWGDPRSNELLGKVIGNLPIRWNEKSIRIGQKSFPANDSAPILIYPNPLNPTRYVVLNSGFTFSEVAHSSNALQTPKLPDFAVVNINVPDAKRDRHGVLTAGFFDENWVLPGVMSSK